MATMIWMQAITKTYRLGEVTVPVLKRIDLAIEHPNETSDSSPRRFNRTLIWLLI